MFGCDLMNMQNLRSVEITKLRESGLPIFIYGAGSYAQLSRRFLEANNLVVEGFFVDPEFRVDARSVILHEVAEKFGKFNVVLGMANHGAGRLRLLAANCKNINLITNFVLSPHYLDGIDANFVSANNNFLSGVFDWLEDDLSRMTFRNYIAAQISGDDSFLLSVFRGGQYFQDFIPINKYEIFLDGGAFVGDTLGQFLLFNDGCYSRYYAVEPDERNVGLLAEYVEKNSLANVELIGAGLWSDCGVLKFSGAGSTESKVAEDGETVIDVVAIDEVAPDATFIKMDIEGAEMEALNGARNTILNNRPKLAVCVYHEPSHLWEVPSFIKSIHPEYKIYFRQHNTISTELVMYAI
ncbi:MAG: FkbM family methyltransferase [Rhodoferax sp.]